MAYCTHYNLLDKDKKVVKAFEGVACFSDIVSISGKQYFTQDVQYVEYDFHNYNGEKLSEHDLYRYFLFLKNIPEFAEYMPYDIMQMVAEKKIRFDIDKINGLKLFSMLTVVRAVRETPVLVKEVLKFDPEKEYSWTKLGILKACGGVHYENSGHWLTGRVKPANVNKTPETRADWRSTIPARATGLIRLVNATWQWDGDGYAGSPDQVKQTHLDDVRKEQAVPEKKKRAPRKVKEPLQLDF